MNGSPELLEFYLVEATEYIDALDQLIVGASAVPDPNAFIATARALRGSSTMAKAERIAEVSLTLEQLALGLRDGDIHWSRDLFGSIRGTIDDLRLLVRGVRTWAEREETRADGRLTDLRRHLPNAAEHTPSPAASETTPVFVALQASAIAAELEAFVANSANRRALDDALGRVRTMRGIAGIADFPPLAEVADSIDRASRSLMPDAALSAVDAELFRAAAAVLRRASGELRAHHRSDPESPEVERFARAAAAHREGRATGERVVLIDELFYSDTGPHVVERAPAPPSTPEQRFRHEVISRAEHVRRLVNDARQARDAAARQRVAADLREALGDLESTAASFGVHQAAAFFGQAARESDILAAPLLDAIDTGAVLLLSPSDTIEELERRLAVLERARRVPAPPLARTPGASRRIPVTPTGRELQTLLATGIASFSSLEDEALSEPSAPEETEVVPIDTLLYRGQSALQRAIEVRDSIRQAGATDAASLEEIFDLLDLALAE